VSLFRRLLLALIVGILAGAVSTLGTARAADPSNDEFWDTPPVQWGLLQVGAPAAWTTSTGAGITVGLVDSGVEATHEDLVGKVVGGADCVGSKGNEAACTPGGTSDTLGHGTHVAGIVAALTNNGIGVASVAPGAQILSVQAVGADGSGTDAEVGAGIRWVVDHGASVVNLSLGAEGTRVAFGPGFSSAVEYAWSHGAIPVVAAGNSAQSPNYGSLHMVVVAGTTPGGQLASYSNHVDGAQWGVAAPGGAADGNPFDDIVSTYKGNSYAAIAGTSMATAHVSGALALLRAKGYTRDDAVPRLLTTAVPCAGCGSGRVDAAAAVGAGAAPPPAVPPGGGGNGSTTPGSATIVGPAPNARPASNAPPRAAVPRTTASPTTAATQPPATVTSTTTPLPDIGDIALGSPPSLPVQVNNAGPRSSGSSDRAIAVGLALTGLLGAGACLGVRAWRRGT
jgi:subtilisin family serine protease